MPEVPFPEGAGPGTPGCRKHAPYPASGFARMRRKA